MSSSNTWRCAFLTLAMIAVSTSSEALDNAATSGIVRTTAKTDRLGVVDISVLKSGIDALTSGDLDLARTVRDGLPVTSLDRRVLDWIIALKGGRQISSSEISAVVKILADWPGAEALRRNREHALLRENSEPLTIIQFLGGPQPETTKGVIALARAYVAVGDSKSALSTLLSIWRTNKIEPGDEAAILKEFGDLIPAADHRIRMERMLYAGRVNSARLLAERTSALPLFNAWVAVEKKQKLATKLLEAVPIAQRSAGYLFAKAKHLRRNEKYSDAAAIVLRAPNTDSELIDPDAWWIERRVLSRELLDHGDARNAYKIAAGHSAESTVNQVDAEFHAGWYALRGMGDAVTGARHFARLAEIADGPISRSRAYYWLGRCAEAGGPGNAKDYYQRAAAFSSSFYGQLAAARIGLTTINPTAPLPSASDRMLFHKREAVAAIRRLEAAGYQNLADTLYRDLAGQLTSPGELALLTTMAENRGNHYLALRIAKIAAARGIETGALLYPVGAIPSSADISGSGKALAYAVARQESEFNVGAVSHAGARGLLQLMPDTAASVAKEAGLSFSAMRLTSDAGYNATLGATFLGSQLERFNGSYVLTFAGYNAGPKRALEWIRRYGDPRGKDIDTVVDWIEHIPYSETRSYVQRVMENYQVYKMRLTGQFDIEHDLVTGR